MNTLKQDIDQLIIHRIAGNLGETDWLVTEALINNLRRIQNEQLIDSIIAHEIEASNDE